MVLLAGFEDWNLVWKTFKLFLPWQNGNIVLAGNTADIMGTSGPPRNQI